jgi:hypothetical protein
MITSALSSPLTPTPAEFFAQWQIECQVRVHELLANWEQGGSYTATVFGGPAFEVGRKFDLECYLNYYSLDAVYFRRDDDAVADSIAPPNSTWLHNIRIAFEHENYFRSGLYQETSHLLITRAELRVLVTYPETEDSNEIERELGVLHQIISSSGLSEPAFLIVLGRRTSVGHGLWNGVEWRGRVYARSGWIVL